VKLNAEIFENATKYICNPEKINEDIYIFSQKSGQKIKKDIML